MKQNLTSLEIVEEKTSTAGNEEFISLKDGMPYVMKMKEIHPWLSLGNIEMIFVKGNKIGITYGKHPEKAILEIFNVNDHSFCDYYAVDFVDKKPILKVYDQNFASHPLPPLPAGCRLDPLRSGIGVYYSEEHKYNNRKLYFLHGHPPMVYDYYKHLNPEIKIWPEKSLVYFAIEYDITTGKVASLSQYDTQEDAYHNATS